MMFKSSFVFGTWILFAAMVAHADSKDVNAQFISAASSGSLSRVQSLLAQGAQLNTQDIIGDSALHWAALECHLDVVKFLTAQPGIQMNPRDSAGDLPLGLAGGSGCLPVVQSLVEDAQKRVDLNATNHTGETALWVAATHGHSDVVQYLTSNPGVNINAADTSNITPLWSAAVAGADGFLDIVQDLVSHHAALEVVGGYDKSTALAAASAAGHLAIVKFFVSAGANRLAKDGAGLTPAQKVCSQWAGLPIEDGGADCPQAELVKALSN